MKVMKVMAACLALTLLTCALLGCAGSTHPAPSSSTAPTYRTDPIEVRKRFFTGIGGRKYELLEWTTLSTEASYFMVSLAGYNHTWRISYSAYLDDGWLLIDLPPTGGPDKATASIKWKDGKIIEEKWHNSSERERLRPLGIELYESLHYATRK
jgi:hypothetical protein